MKKSNKIIAAIYILATTLSYSCKKENDEIPPAIQQSNSEKIAGVYDGRVSMLYFMYSRAVSFEIVAISPDAISIKKIETQDFVLETTCNIDKVENGLIHFNPQYKLINSSGIDYINTNGSYGYYDESSKRIDITLLVNTSDGTSEYYFLRGTKK